VLQQMAAAVHKTGNAMLVDKYAQKTALRLGVTPEAVRAEFKKASRSKGAPPVAVEETGGEAEAVASETPRPSAPEFWLLKLVLLHEETVEWVHAHLDLNWVQHPHIRHAITLRLGARAKDTWQGIAAFLTECEAGELRHLITEATAEDRAILNSQQQLGDITLRLRNQFIDRQLAALTQRANQAGTGEEEHLDLMRQQQALRELKRQPLAPLAGDANEPF